jgi:hypothetical protein
LRARGHPDSSMASRRFAPHSRHSATISPCSSTFSQTTEHPCLATGNVPAARLTQPHTRLKWLRVRSYYQPWNKPRCAGCAAGRASGRDRPPELLRGQENDDPSGSLGARSGSTSASSGAGMVVWPASTACGRGLSKNLTGISLPVNANIPTNIQAFRRWPVRGLGRQARRRVLHPRSVVRVRAEISNT